VNRRIEARFQWNHARDMQPEPEDLPNILKKIEFGLPDEPSKDAPADPRAPDQKSGGSDCPRRRLRRGFGGRPPKSI
jgi:hypothetical protein